MMPACYCLFRCLLQWIFALCFFPGADISLLDLNEEMLTNLVDFYEGGSAPVEISKVSKDCLGMASVCVW